MSDAKCAKKIMGNKPVSQATPEQLRKIEECGIRAAGGKPNPKVFGKSKEKSPASMGSALYGKISSACKAAAKRKFKVWPSAYASGWGVRCTKAGGPGNYGGGKKKK